MRSASCWLLASFLAAACASAAPRQPTIVVVVEQGRSHVDRQAAASAAAAAAQRKEKHREEDRARQPGASVTVGSGLTRTAWGGSAGTNLGVAWTVRLAIGTRRWLGVEWAYLGSLRAVASQAAGPEAGLMQNGFETLMRMNLGAGVVQPYAVAGGGWARYALVNGGASLVDTRDDVITMPVGAGVTVYLGRHTGIASTLDLRFMYQLALGEDLPDEMQARDLDLWIASLQAGWEF